MGELNFGVGTEGGAHKRDQDPEPERQEEWSVCNKCYKEVL